MIVAQKLPECAGVPLHTIRSADDKNCVIKHLKRALHLRGEIHMTWRIKKCDVSHPRLLRKNRDTTLPFLRIIVQICILMIDTSDALDLSTRIKHRL